MSVSDTGPRPRPTDTTRPLAPNASGTGPGPGRRGPAKARGRWALVAVLVLAAIVIAWVLTHQKAPTAAGGPGGPGGGRRGGGAGGVTSVNAAKATIADVPVYVTALGTVTPAATVTVRTQLAGQLFSVNFTEGQNVSKGQVLAQVDPRPYQQALEQARGNLARDQAQLSNANLDLQRYETLLKQDSIARQTVDTQRATVRQLQGTLVTDRAAVAAAQLNVNYTRITAPVSGRVGLRQVDPGNYVANGDANGIVTIAQINPIDVVFTVPEDQIGAVAKGMRAGKVPVTVFDRSQSDALAEGVLLTLDNQIDTTTGTVKAKARFANAGDTLFPNQFVNVRVLVGTLGGSVVVPTSAIQRGQQGLFVYTVDTNNAVHMTAVTTGPAVGENTQIASGLQAGATVVTDGSDRLREGGRVLLPGDCAPTGGPGGGSGGQGGRGAGGAAGGQATEKKGNWFTNLFGGKKADAPATAEPGAAGGGRHRGAGAQMGVGPDGKRCRKVDLSKGGGNAMEQRTQAMLDQLGLSPDQKSKIQKIRDDGRDKMMAAMQSGDFAAMRAQRTAVSKQMEAVMTPAQRTKYEQLRADMQAQMAAGGGFGGGMGGGGMGGGGGGAGGGMAAGAPPSSGGAAPATTGASASTTTTTTSTTTRGPGGGQAAAPGGRGLGGAGGRGAGMFAELGLTPAQQSKIDAIRAADGPKVREAYQSGDMAAAKAAGDAMRAKIEAVMTPEQRTKAAALRERMRASGGMGGGAAPQ